MRAPETLAMHEGVIVTAAGALATSSNHVALCYSGGAESGLLLHLLRPLSDLISVVWVNPGTLAHEAEHVRKHAEGWPRFVELPSDREAAWREQGLPTRLLPVELDPFFMGDAPRSATPRTSNRACCERVRWRPMMQWAAEQGVTLLIHRQRRGEGTRLYEPGILPPHWGPLATWTRAEVMARLAYHNVPLSRQYGAGYPASIECAVCPADLAPARLRFLKDHYPAEYGETVRLAAEATEPALRYADTLRKQLAEMDAGT
jgi:3'-phosphoadenosine 5'-phosphosulfate sulfotransferase (PAPS reductase)/FAD synthetase